MQFEWDRRKAASNLEKYIRGKYYDRYHEGSNVILLERDVAAVFRNSDAVNRTLRMLIDIARNNAATEGETSSS